MKTNEFIAKVAPMAQKAMAFSGVLASLTIAQAILESGWGESGLTKKGNALFGIKASSSWKGKRLNCKTFEFYSGNRVDIVDAFRAYDSWQESVNDHSNFVCGVRLGNNSLRYQAVIGEKDYKKACHAIHKAGYATAPNYATSLIKIIEDYKLYQYDNVDMTQQPQAYYIWCGKFLTKADAEKCAKLINGLPGNPYCEIREVK